MARRRMLALTAVWAVLLSGCKGSGGNTPVSPSQPPPVAVSFTPVAGGLNLPVHIGHAGDGSGRLFLVEQPGRILILGNGTVLPTPFLDIRALVLSGGERGLFSVAFPPGYPSKGYFYVDYTRVPDGATVVARYSVTADPNIADNGSETVLLTVAQPFSNHNGGQLAFGPDGYLYVGMGDGGSGGDPQNNAQSPGSLLGKLLRLDVESGAVPYGIPADNPFLSDPTFLEEIWALGLRNPWRFSFDRDTGDLYLADVGQNRVEEVDFLPFGSGSGSNYGWSVMEGDLCFSDPFCTPDGLVLPVATYDHSQGCSVTGGYVYRGSSYPALQGLYFFGDFCSGRVWGLRRNGTSWENVLLSDTAFSISTFGEDETGDLYLADYGSGTVYRIVSP